MEKIKILAIETSCDETAAAVIGEKDGSPVILSNIVSSQIDLHAKTGGVVPEVASRAHMEAIAPVTTQALVEGLESRAKSNVNGTLNPEHSTLNYQKAILALSDITHIAVTAGPGLIGSLLVGFNAAKTLSYLLNLPIVPINHIEGHIYSALSGISELESRSSNSELRTSIFPVIALTVSGGHTSITLMEDHLSYVPIGQTIDDAAGEAFDKVAKLLGLGYPGGPVVSKLARQFRGESRKGKVERGDKNPSTLYSLPSTDIVFPRPIINDHTFNFSFSGLKTAVLVKVKELTSNGHVLTDEIKEEICFAFEEAVIDVLATKTIRAAEKHRVKGILLGGGVSANKRLQEELKNRIERYNSEVEAPDKMNFYFPKPELMGDNAAMIGMAAYYHIKRGDVNKWSEVNVDSNLELINN